MVLTAGVFPSEADARTRMPLIYASAEKFKIPLHVYGIGFPHYPGFIDLKIRQQLAYLKANRADYTHVLYTDGRDAFFVGPLDEIIEKYRPYQDQFVASCGRFPMGNVELEHWPEHYHDFSLTRSHYVYPHVGGYIAPIGLLIDTLERFMRDYADRPDDMYVWHHAWVDGWFRPFRDLFCQIFQVLEYRTTEDDLSVHEWRLFNKSHGTYPCIFHLSGGYSDPVKGKPEWIGPWWRRLHPDYAGVMPE